MADSQVIPSTVPHFLQPVEAVEVSLFDQELCNSGISDGSGEVCIMEKVMRSHILCRVLGWIFEKSHAILHRDCLARVQDALKWVEAP